MHWISSHARQLGHTGTHAALHAQEPVVTPEGFVYSKQAIVENLLAQKKAIKKKLAAWQAAQEEAQRKARDEHGAVNSPGHRLRCYW
jgi:nitric oxide synthase-interacting protein